jgi:hypothetical protein
MLRSVASPLDASVMPSELKGGHAVDQRGPGLTDDPIERLALCSIERRLAKGLSIVEQRARCRPKLVCEIAIEIPLTNRSLDVGVKLTATIRH